MEQVQVKFQEWLIEGLELYKNNFAFLLLASVLVLLISFLMFGILAGPMIGGLITMSVLVLTISTLISFILAGPMIGGLVIMVLSLHRDEKPGIRMLFTGFGHFMPLALFFLVWGICISLPAAALTLIPVFGKALALIFSLAGYGFLMFGPFLIVDQDFGFWSGSMKSIKTVGGNSWPFLEFGAIAAIFGQLGCVLLGVGLVITLPLQVCMLVIAYREIFCGIVTENAVRPRADISRAVASAAAQRNLSGKESGDQALRATMVRSRMKDTEKKTVWKISEEEAEEIEQDTGGRFQKK